ncbi:hypothetical protein [Granulicoccus sp. GXG6511]|uniref:hypothetical protein n=1 Tax=Granulicoccus sp. GXG6511 TaxID=3381351 RepID=UPI003D7EBD0B
MTEDPLQRALDDLTVAREHLARTQAEMMDDLGRLVDAWESDENEGGPKEAYHRVLQAWSGALEAMDRHLSSLDKRRSAKGFPPV